MKTYLICARVLDAESDEDPDIKIYEGDPIKEIAGCIEALKSWRPVDRIEACDDFEAVCRSIRDVKNCYGGYEGHRFEVISEDRFRIYSQTHNFRVDYKIKAEEITGCAAPEAQKCISTKYIPCHEGKRRPEAESAVKRYRVYWRITAQSGQNPPEHDWCASEVFLDPDARIDSHDWHEAVIVADRSDWGAMSKVIRIIAEERYPLADFPYTEVHKYIEQFNESSFRIYSDDHTAYTEYELKAEADKL